ncbi:MAG: CRTAC1 family protein [Fimbriiglobus sp.]
MFQHLGTWSKDPPASAGGVFVDARGTGRYEAMPGLLASGPILSHRMDLFRRMPIGCLGLYSAQNDGSYEPCGAEYGLHIISDLPPGLFLFDSQERGQLDLFVPGVTGPHRLLVRQIDGTYRDEATPGLAWPGDVTGVVLADFDNDGHEEMILATTEETRLFRCPGPTRLEQKLPGATRLYAGDVNNDGRVELLLDDQLYAANGSGDVIRIEPMTRFWEPAYGATVKLLQAQRTDLRLISGGTGYGLIQEPVAHFGLSESPDTVTAIITWPSGARRSLTDIPTNTNIRLRPED